jgi:hypothetical protein
MTGHGPSPDIPFPIAGIDRLGFLKNFIIRPNIIVGAGCARVERLLALAWWEWDAETVTRNVLAICGGDIDAFERAV